MAKKRGTKNVKPDYSNARLKKYTKIQKELAKSHVKISKLTSVLQVKSKKVNDAKERVKLSPYRLRKNLKRMLKDRAAAAEFVSARIKFAESQEANKRRVLNSVVTQILNLPKIMVIDGADVESAVEMVNVHKYKGEIHFRKGRWFNKFQATVNETSVVTKLV